MSYIKPELVAKAKEMDLLTYLKNYEPGQLVKLSGGEYCTKEHDSLKISNGKWCWWSRGIGDSFFGSGRNYFRTGGSQTACPNATERKRERGELIIPKMVASPTTAYWYLTEQRMIDWKIVMDCFRKKLIKETENHEVAFIGYDENGVIRCINLRATDDSDFKKTVYGSDRQFAFRLVTEKILFFIYTRQRLTYFLTLPY